MDAFETILVVDVLRYHYFAFIDLTMRTFAIYVTHLRDTFKGFTCRTYGIQPTTPSRKGIRYIRMGNIKRAYRYFGLIKFYGMQQT